MENIFESPGRLIGIVESLEVVDSIYGISKDDREVLDVIRGIKDLKTE